MAIKELAKRRMAKEFKPSITEDEIWAIRDERGLAGMKRFFDTTCVSDPNNFAIPH